MLRWLKYIQTRNNANWNLVGDAKFVTNANVKSIAAIARQGTAPKGVSQRLQELLSQGMSQAAALDPRLSSHLAADTNSWRQATDRKLDAEQSSLHRSRAPSPTLMVRLEMESKALSMQLLKIDFVNAR